MAVPNAATQGGAQGHDCLLAKNGALGIGVLQDDGETLFVPLKRIRTQRQKDKAAYRFYNQYEIRRPRGGGGASLPWLYSACLTAAALRAELFGPRRAAAGVGLAESWLLAIGGHSSRLRLHRSRQSTNGNLVSLAAEDSMQPPPVVRFIQQTNHSEVDWAHLALAVTYLGVAIGCVDGHGRQPP